MDDSLNIQHTIYDEVISLTTENDLHYTTDGTPYIFQMIIMVLRAWNHMGAARR
jgi:hypothetical protein